MDIIATVSPLLQSENSTFKQFDWGRFLVNADIGHINWLELLPQRSDSLSMNSSRCTALLLSGNLGGRIIMVGLSVDTFLFSFHCFIVPPHYSSFLSSCLRSFLLPDSPYFLCKSSHVFRLLYAVQRKQNCRLKIKHSYLSVSYLGPQREDAILRACGCLLFLI